MRITPMPLRSFAVAVGFGIVAIATGSCGPDNDTPGKYEKLVPVKTFEVSVSVVSDSGPLGALQWNLAAVGVNGGWQGRAGAVDCDYHVGAIRQCNDKGSGMLACALIDTVGFATPSTVATCRIEADSEPTPGDFELTLVDASSPDLNAEPPAVDIAVTEIFAR